MSANFSGVSGMTKPATNTELIARPISCCESTVQRLATYVGKIDSTNVQLDWFY